MTTSPSSTTPEALAAASWAVEQPNFRDLINGHRARRIPIMKDGYRADDNTEADAWLIEQWKAAEQ